MPQKEPQCPQLARSVDVSTQPAPQATSGAAQPARHCPATQDIPDAHVREHAPQFDGSSARSTQALPHRLLPEGHEQEPLAQTCPEVQARVQTPQ